MKKPIVAVIEDVVIQPEKIQPIIVNFQNGQLKDEETKKMKCGLYTDEKNNKIVLAMSNDQVVYKGYRPELSKELTYTMLAIHNKKTGKVRLIQAERWDVAPVLDERIENNNDEEIDKTIALNKQFGSKKVKRRTEQYERMKINVDNIKEQLDKTVSNVEIEKSDLEPASKDDFLDGSILPFCNREATDESKIYALDDIVPKNILESLYSQADKVLKGEFGEKPEFFVKTVENVRNDQNCTMKIAILLYIESVLGWLNEPIKMAKKSDLVVCPYSTEVNTYIIDTYSIMSGNGRQRPNTMRDKGIIHCIILGLMIWNYTLDLELLSSMLKLRLGIRKLLDLARWISAVPTKDKKTVCLKLPLPPPISNVLIKKKRVRN